MDEKEARKIIKNHENGKCEECFEGACMDEANGFLEGLEQGRKEERQRAERVVEKAMDVCTYPGFVEGTKTFEGLPRGLYPRIRDLKETLSKYHSQDGHEKGE